MADYPQSEKLAAAQGERETIAGFIEWLRHQGIQLCNSEDSYPWFSGITVPEDTLIMQYLEINENELEQERRAMLAAAREES